MNIVLFEVFLDFVLVWMWVWFVVWLFEVVEKGKLWVVVERLVVFVFECCDDIIVLVVWLGCEFGVIVFCFVCVLDIILLVVFLVEGWEGWYCVGVIDVVWNIGWKGDWEFVLNFDCNDNKEFKDVCGIDWVLFCDCVLVVDEKFLVDIWRKEFKF